MTAAADIPLFDLIVLGSGPGGERAAATAGLFGKRVAMVEKSPVLGGASTNTGTIPSKTFRETAIALSGLRARDLYGVDLSLRRDATIRDFMYHEEQVKDSERERVGQNLATNRVERFRGTGAFVDPNTISVSGGSSSDLLLRAEKILIATGSSPVRPAIFPFGSDRVHDSDEILTLHSLPGSLAVVGAGVIGAEYACTFAALGTKVHLIDGRTTLLPFLDREIAQGLERAMKKLGIAFHWGETVTACETPADDKVRLICASGEAFELDGVLVAAGRQSNVELLNLAAAGITAGERGLLRVNSDYATEVPHIYAVGDVIGFPALAATSAEQGRIAVCHAFNKQLKKGIPRILPTGIYTIPEVSMAGETEDSLQKQGIPYLVGRASYMQNARGMIIGDSEGMLKLLFRKDDLTLAGVHAVGEQATELVHIGLMALLLGAGGELFNEACFNYPTLGDLYKTATYDAMLPQLLSGCSVAQ